ncbi:YunG family protein [Cupriavidus pampae]|uniref:Uncharacterized protein n=1 Tax=Cupriavidus pampae TaxID=659251 RepID=A0ABN7ZQ81_9BURK|nr:hypothetical protein [Cupriavidus pampae]CAG9186236.1 hypothetical protein LMG32289_06329 [Cupriavidus pampae]
MRFEAPPATTGLLFLDVPSVVGSPKEQNQMTSVSRTFATPLDLYRAISRVWAGDTSSPAGVWSPSNPAQNHCSITSLVVQDHFGGEILTTRTSGGTHFYNLIDGKKWDLTVSQFAEPVPYDDTPSTRDEALADTSQQKYETLTSRLKEALTRET